MNKPLPPTRASDAVCILSPLVLIGTISTTSSLRRLVIASFMTAACAKARTLGREPIRKVKLMGEIVCIL